MRSKQERNQIITSEEKGRVRNHWRRGAHDMKIHSESDRVWAGFCFSV